VCVLIGGRAGILTGLHAYKRAPIEKCGAVEKAGDKGAEE